MSSSRHLYRSRIDGTRNVTLDCFRRSQYISHSRSSAGKMMTLALRAGLAVVSLLLLFSASVAQAQDASPSPTPSPSPTATAAPTAVPLPDIVSASDSALERL